MAWCHLWQQKKKPANVVFVLDTSGSMNDDGKIQNAREGLEFVPAVFREGTAGQVKLPAAN